MNILKVTLATATLFTFTTNTAWSNPPLPRAKPEMHYAIVPVHLTKADHYNQDQASFTKEKPETLNLEDISDRFTVGRKGDLTLSCNEIIDEARAMQEIAALSEREVSQSEMHEAGISVAGALGSFLIGSLTGGIGFAAAGYLAKEIPEEHAELAEQIGDTAEQRASLMMGIYQAQECVEPWPFSPASTPNKNIKDNQDSQTKSPMQKASYALTNKNRYNK